MRVQRPPSEVESARSGECTHLDLGAEPREEALAQEAAEVAADHAAQ